MDRNILCFIEVLAVTSLNNSCYSTKLLYFRKSALKSYTSPFTLFSGGSWLFKVEWKTVKNYIEMAESG